MASWRDSARTPRFFFIDGRAAFPLLFFLLHIREWTFIGAILVMLFFTGLERYGFTPPIFFRWLRGVVAGPHKAAKPWWKR
jgi:intracellular multiplication protein IcmT